MITFLKIYTTQRGFFQNSTWNFFPSFFFYLLVIKWYLLRRCLRSTFSSYFTSLYISVISQTFETHCDVYSSNNMRCKVNIKKNMALPHTLRKFFFSSRIEIFTVRRSRYLYILASSYSNTRIGLNKCTEIVFLRCELAIEEKRRDYIKYETMLHKIKIQKHTNSSYCIINWRDKKKFSITHAICLRSFLIWSFQRTLSIINSIHMITRQIRLYAINARATHLQ